MSSKGEILKQRAYRELKEFLLLSLYLWLFLGMLVVFKSMVLAQYRIEFAPHGAALINALVLAKFMLVVRAIQPGKRVDNAPLIYPTLLKSALFAIALMVLKILEDAVVGHFHSKSFTASLADLGGGDWRVILVYTLILFLALIPVTAFGELQRVLGESKLYDLFLRSRDVSGSS